MKSILHLKRLSFRVPKLTVFSLLVMLLLYSNIINLSNYSILSYTFSGGGYSNPLFELVKYSRLPVVLIGMLVFSIVIVRNAEIRDFVIRNTDIYIFLAIMFFGLFNSVDLINGLLYTVWQSAALISILLFLYFLYINSNSQEEFTLRFFQILFWSNAFVLPFLFLNIKTLGSGWTYYMAFSGKTFYPYCLLTMVLSIYGSRVLAHNSIFNQSRLVNLWLELFLIVSMIFFCFVSARRTPLFLIVLVTPIFSYLAIGRRIWKKATFVLSFTAFLAISIPLSLSYIEEHRYELAVLKKLNDLAESSGDVSEDGSYNERLLVWDSYFEVHKRYRIIGVGSYNSGVVQANMFKGTRIEGYSTHNLYLGVLVEHGILGLFMFVILILRSLVILFSNTSLLFSLLYSGFFVIPILITNWNEYNLIPGQVFYWSTMLVLLFPRILLLKRKGQRVQTG